MFYLNFSFHLAVATDVRYEVESGEADAFDDAEIDYLNWSTPPKEIQTQRLDVAKLTEALQVLVNSLGIEVVPRSGPEGLSWELVFDGRLSPAVIADELLSALLPLGIDPSAALTSAGNTLVRIDDKGGVVRETVVTLWALREGLAFGAHRRIVERGKEKEEGAPMRAEALEEAQARAETERRLEELEERARARRESAELGKVREDLATAEAERDEERRRRAAAEERAEALKAEVERARAQRDTVEELLAAMLADIPRERVAPAVLVRPEVRIARAKAERNAVVDAILERIHAREEERRAKRKLRKKVKRDAKGRFMR